MGPMVLVVEDDAALRTLLADILAGEGYAILEAEHGLQALALAAEQAPALILTDQWLPKMTGLELLERLRAGEGTRHIPVVLISGFEASIALAGPQPDRVLKKPFDIDALLDDVTSLAPLGSCADGAALTR